MTRNKRQSQEPTERYAPRRGRASPAGEDALSQAAAALGRAGFSDATLVLRWREIVGADIARIAEPVRLNQEPGGGVLTLKCDPGAAVFLQHQTRELLSRLASYLGTSRIARLRFVPGELAPAAGLAEHPRAGVVSSDEPSVGITLAQALERLEQRRATARPKRTR